MHTISRNFSILPSHIFKRVYGNLSYMMKHPSDIIGFFYSLHKIVLDYDPLVDKLVMHDDAYDKDMT